MDRRNFIKIAGMSSGYLYFANQYNSAKNILHNACKPNVILILADDLGYGDIGCYGQKKINTPNLDKFASEGMRFTNCYSGSPVCAPSRNCLMTGQHTGHTRIRHNSSSFNKERVPLESSDLTVAEVFKSAGYSTGLIGKWGLGEPDTSGIPNKKGFDYFFGYLNQNHAHFYYPEYLWRNEEKVFYPENNNKKRGTYSHDLIADEALEFVKRNRSNPFFLHLTFTIPHAELLVPEDSLDEYKNKFPENKPFPGEKDGYAAQETPHAAYAAMITRMDKDVGRLMKLVKDLGIDDHTLIFFTSDNGPSDAAGSDPDFFNSNGNLRGAKYNLYEGGIRVPMLVRYPKKIKPAVSDYPWAFWDYMPTMCNFLNVKPKSGLDGISVLPVLCGKNQKEHEYFYWEIKADKKNFNQAVRMGNWKAVRANPDKPVELYNLSNDEGETKDVSLKNPGIVKQIEEIMRNSHTESKYWPMFTKKNEE